MIAIIGVLASVAATGLSKLTRSSNLTAACQRLADQINVGRQIASARNLPVEVRLYNLPEWDTTTGPGKYMRGVQLFILDGTTNPVSKPYYFPARVIISTNPTVSPMLTKMNSGTSRLGQYKTVSYQSFTIRANGRLAPNTIDTNNFLTLHQENDPKNGADTPLNFGIIQINPVSGKVSVLRP